MQITNSKGTWHTETWNVRFSIVFWSHVFRFTQGINIYIFTQIHVPFPCQKDTQLPGIRADKTFLKVEGLNLLKFQNLLGKTTMMVGSKKNFRNTVTFGMARNCIEN